VTDVRAQAVRTGARLHAGGPPQAAVSVIGELLANRLCRYARWPKPGGSSCRSPLRHPILPLLLDFASAREAMPVPAAADAATPAGERARPGTWPRAGVFERISAFAPTGCWPSEGAISTATLELMENNGFAGRASGRACCDNSWHATKSCRSEAAAPPLSQWRQRALLFLPRRRTVGPDRLHLFDWHADDAVGISSPASKASPRMATRDGWCRSFSTARTPGSTTPTTAITSWRCIAPASTSALSLTTFATILRGNALPEPSCPVVAGSWVYGTFSTWIGDPDKNRGWELLCEAKAAFDRRFERATSIPSSSTRRERQLAVCEGSDWFWWFGDYNPADSVSGFRPAVPHASGEPLSDARQGTARVPHPCLLARQHRPRSRARRGDAPRSAGRLTAA
jgi:hypothetical protein